MLRFVLSTCAALTLCGHLLRADVLYQTSFESPAFSTGAINGQDGWQVSSNPATLFQIGTGASAYSGAQFVAVNTATASANGLQRAFRPQVIMPVNPPSVIRASVYASVRNNQAPTSTRVSGAGLELFAENGTFRIASLAMRNDGLITLINGFNQTSLSPVGAIDARVYHQLAIEADFAAHKLKYFIDGIELLPPGNFGVFQVEVTGFGNASLHAARASTTSGSGLGGHTVLFDDFQLQQIPSPGALAVGAGAAGIGFRRRRISGQRVSIAGTAMSGIIGE